MFTRFTTRSRKGFKQWRIVASESKLRRRSLPSVGSERRRSDPKRYRSDPKCRIRICGERIHPDHHGDIANSLLRLSAIG
jgi:hypothetical protein